MSDRSAILFVHVEPAVKQALVARAEAHERSLSQELRFLLRRELEQDEQTR